MVNEGQWILVVDNDIQIRRLLRSNLQAQHYRIFEANIGRDALEKVMQLHPDIIILDLGLPDIDGLTVLQRLRQWTQTPVIILSERNTDRDKITALDAGADDYLVKPFSVDELQARIRVAHRHTQLTHLISGDLQVDLAQRLVTVHGERIKLTPTEYAILRLLAQHAGNVVTYEQILRGIWGPAHGKGTHYLHVYIAQLRQKLEVTATTPQIILTEFGVGYRLIAQKA